MQVPERSATSTLAGSLRLAAQGGLRARAQPTSAQQGSQMETTTPIRPTRQQEHLRRIALDAGPVIVLDLGCACGQLRVAVHDTSRFVPTLMDAPADAEAGRGLMLVATLSDDWGYYRTRAGKAVYFTLG